MTGTFISKNDKGNKVKTEYLGNNQLLFEIEIASKKCAMGAYKDVANIININKSVFKKVDFELTLFFSGKGLEIKSKGKDDDLGMYCYPEGSYVR